MVGLAQKLGKSCRLYATSFRADFAAARLARRRPRCAGPAGMLLAEMAWAGVKVAAELSVTIAVGSGW
jgi:hypothetical protein